MEEEGPGAASDLARTMALLALAKAALASCTAAATVPPGFPPARAWEAAMSVSKAAALATVDGDTRFGSGSRIEGGLRDRSR